MAPHQIPPSSLLWKKSLSPVRYEEALLFMDRQVKKIQRGEGQEMVWLLGHPPLYTAGTSAKPSDLLEPARFPVYPTGRGGQYTYHGPGQRIAYVMLDLAKRQKKDVRHYVYCLEEWVLLTLSHWGIKGHRRKGDIGVWVMSPSKQEEKIAAIGIRISRWVTSHGIALNLSPDLSHYKGIIPCGIQDKGITSFQALGYTVSFKEVDSVLKKAFFRVFGEQPIV